MSKLLRPSSATHTIDGRLRGSYVYLLLFDEHGFVYAKVGLADDPIARLMGLLTGCPFEPVILAACALPNRAIAAKVECALHRAFDEWHLRGEWFRLQLEDRERFNALWKAAVAEFATPSWPIHWTKLNAEELLKQLRRSGRYASLQAAKRAKERARLGITREDEQS